MTLKLLKGKFKWNLVLLELQERAAVPPVDYVQPGWNFGLFGFSLTFDLLIQHKEIPLWSKLDKKTQSGHVLCRQTTQEIWILISLPLSFSIQRETWIPKRPVWSAARRKRAPRHQTELPSHWPPLTTPPPPSWATGQTPWDKCKTQQHLLPPEWSEDFTYKLICCCTFNSNQRVVIQTPVQKR